MISHFEISLFSSIMATVLTTGGGFHSLFLYILYTQQINNLYKPTRTQAGHDDDQAILLTEDQIELRGWIDNPGQDKALIYFGGSSESIEMRRSSLAEHFPHHTRYFVPHRGYGPNFHLHPDETMWKKDGEHIYSHVAKQHQQVDIIGRSLGTSIAVHVAARYPIHRLALITPFDSILSIAQHRYRFLPIRKILPDLHEVWKDAIHLSMPIMACLAQNDLVTPHRFWRNLRDYIKTDVKEIYHDLVDHSTIALSSHTWHTISQFFSATDTNSNTQHNVEKHIQ